MKIENGESVSISVTNGLFRICTVEADSGKRNSVYLTPYQAGVVARFIKHNLEIAVEQDELNYDLDDRDCEPLEICPALLAAMAKK